MDMRCHPAPLGRSACLRAREDEPPCAAHDPRRLDAASNASRSFLRSNAGRALGRSAANDTSRGSRRRVTSGAGNAPSTSSGPGAPFVGSALVAFGLLLLALATPTVAADGVDRRVEESLALCADADRVAPNERLPILARGLELADAAVALDARSARAHFAVVCNLGKATGIAGIGFGTFGAVRRLRQEIDATLALAPNDAEALAAKGALLIKLPRWLGGDRREAVLWLRRALAVDPTNATAHAYLDEIGVAAPPFVAPATDTAILR